MKLNILPCGDLALSVRMGEEIDPRVNGLAARLGALAGNIPGVAEAVPTYCGLTVHYDPEIISFPALAAALETLDPGEEEIRERAVATIPVCYGGEYGPDLEELARHCGLTPGEVVDIHTGGVYHVYMLGFTPGFPYLGGMDPRIAMPRLTTPRTRIPAGSVGIAGQQTGIYPVASPGGWRLIGRTPLRLFDPAREDAALLKAGMGIRFVSITPGEFDTYKEAAHD